MAPLVARGRTALTEPNRAGAVSHSMAPSVRHLRSSRRAESLLRLRGRRCGAAEVGQQIDSASNGGNRADRAEGDPFTGAGGQGGAARNEDAYRGGNWATTLIDRFPLLRDSLAGPMMMTVNAYWLSQTIYVAVKLGIPDVLARHGSMSVCEIAEEVGAQPRALYRLMRSLGGQGPVPGLFVEVFPPPAAADLPFPLSFVPAILPTVKSIVPRPIKGFVPDELPFKLPIGLWRSVDEQDLKDGDLERRYTLTPLGALMRDNMEGGIRDVTLMSGAEMYQAWGKLEESVKTGGAGFDAAYGQDLWDFYASTPDAAATFDESMSDLTTIHTAPGSAAATFDFSYNGTCTSICDIGGGQGRFLSKVLQRFPGVNGILYDQKSVLGAVERGGFLQEKGLLGDALNPARVTLAPGSFFDEDTIPQGCDVYTLKHIIHDWDDENSIVILSNVAKAMKNTSRVLLVEVVVPEDNNYNPFNSEFTSYFDLHMLVTVGGAERRPSEFSRVLQASGLELVKIHKGSGPASVMSIVEAKLS